MTPVAFHRRTGAEKVTDQFIRLATRLLLWGMLPLLVAISVNLSWRNDNHRGSVCLPAGGSNRRGFCRLWFIFLV